jgi:hypothetical protein
MRSEPDALLSGILLVWYLNLAQQEPNEILEKFGKEESHPHSRT